ncbi:MAG: hypothetical protein Q8P19_00375 [bacterium]|nr:hypothetical protein [bacterium]
MTEDTRTNYWKLSTFALALILALAGINAVAGRAAPDSADIQALAQEVIPEEGVTLPVLWGNLGAQMVDSGVIDRDEFEQLYAGRGGMSDGTRELLSGDYQKRVVMTRDNAGELLNLLWAFGLGNKNPILADTTEMMNPDYGGAGNFASTGGWSIADGDPMQHYGAHSFVILTPEQQALVDNVSKNIYRPCCGNSTHFPDCNHGMAMLGLLELMAANGVSEDEMYKVALQVSSYWFPDTYLTIAQYLSSQGTSWEDADPKVILGYEYSSAAGYQRIMSLVTEPAQAGGGGSCGA